MQLITKSEDETKNLAQLMAHDYLKTGGIIGLVGELGAGKTTFAQGFATGLGVKQKIISPTFLTIRQYTIPNSKRIFFHLDLYRFEEEINTKEMGLDEIFKNDENIVLIEWADKIINFLPKNAKILRMKKINGSLREISTS